MYIYSPHHIFFQFTKKITWWRTEFPNVTQHMDHFFMLAKKNKQFFFVYATYYILQLKMCFSGILHYQWKQWHEKGMHLWKWKGLKHFICSLFVLDFCNCQNFFDGKKITSIEHLMNFIWGIIEWTGKMKWLRVMRT